MNRTASTYLMALAGLFPLFATAGSIQWEGMEFETRNVHASLVTLKGEQVLKVERDLKALAFDKEKLQSTVDEPTCLRLRGFEFADGVFEVKMLARVQRPTPFAAAQGFIGLLFRLNADDSAFESIYLRPNVGRSDIQAFRNHAVQYFAYPNFKFDRLRKEAPGVYETYADIGLDEWITMRIHVSGGRAEVYLNDARYPSFIVNQLKGTSESGTIGLYVDIGTEGYFKDFRMISSRHPQVNGGA